MQCCPELHKASIFVAVPLAVLNPPPHQRRRTMRRLSLASPPALETLSRTQLHEAASLRGNNTPCPKRTVSPKTHRQPIDHGYISRVLARKDWSVLLNHELKAKRVVLESRFIVSVLQNQENPVHHLRFFVWVVNAHPGMAKDRSVRRVLGDGLYRNGPVVLSPELVSDVRDAGYPFDEDLLCVLIGSWGRLGLAKYCHEVFGQVSYLGISPSTRLYNAVIDALVKSNSLDMAYLKFQQMASDNCRPDRFTYNIIIHGVCRVGVVDEALRLVKQMEGAGCLPNVFTYTMLIDGFCNANRLSEAFGVLETMKVRNVNPNEATVRSLVNGAFRCEALHKAFELVETFIKKEQVFQSLACDTLLCCLSNKSMATDAGSMLKQFLMRGYSPHSTTLNITMSCLIKGLDHSKTCEIVDLCIDRSIPLGFSTYLTLVEALYRAGRGSDGDKYFHQMVQEGLLSHVFSYNMVIDCFCKVNMVDNASKAFNDMMDRCIAPNLVTFNTLISGHCKIGDIRRAKELLELLLEHRFKPDIFTFSSIIDGLCRVHRIEDALGCLSEMVEWGVSPNAVTYNTIIRSLCITGDVGRSMRLLKRMEMEGINPDVFSFNALIQSFCWMGKIEKAKKLLDSMFMSGLTPDNFTYGAFIRAFCELGRLDDARQLLLSMEKQGSVPDSFLCNLILDNLAVQGRFEEARSISKMCRLKGISVKSCP